MFNNFKATVRRLAELPWEDLRNLFSWPTSSLAQVENPNVLIARAADVNGNVVAYVTAEPILLVDSYALNPTSPTNASQEVGASIDCALAETAGVNRMWVVVPDEAPLQAGERHIRFLERKTQVLAREFSNLPRAALLN